MIFKKNILDVPDNRFDDKMEAWDVVAQASGKAFQGKGVTVCASFGVLCKRMESPQPSSRQTRRQGLEGQERVPARRLKMQIILKSSHQSNCASSISDVSSSTLDERI
jgi:hypothetical protein